MIVEQRALFGIFPIGLKKAVDTYTAIPLAKNLFGKTTEQMIVINEDKISHKTKLPIGKRRIGVVLEYTGEEINTKGLRSRGIVQRVYTYVPGKG